jgi:hypothetical protein
MTIQDRIRAVAALGFTDRQARFLVHVMLFGGLCLPRQYARFNGRAYGHVVTTFFAKLIERGHATACRCLHNRGRVYHVHDRRLYEAIGEPRHAHRRPVPARQVVDRLMLLDGVIAHAELRWLMSDDEKLAFIREIAPTLTPARLPHMAIGAGARRLRLFFDGALMGVDEMRNPTFVYVVRSPVQDDWRRVVARDGDLLGALPRWTFRACFPPDCEATMGHFHVIFREELAEPLAPRTLEELRWYFGQLRGAGPRLARDEERFQRGQVQLLLTPRLRVLYERWVRMGEAAFEMASSHRITEQLANGTGRVNCVGLPVSYRHLLPVNRDHTLRKGVEQGIEQRELGDSCHIDDDSALEDSLHGIAQSRHVAKRGSGLPSP